MPYRRLRPVHFPGSLRRLAPALVLVSALAAGLDGAAADTTDAPPDDAAAAATLDDLRTFSDVFGLVRSSYVDEVPGGQLLDAALQGMVASLDPHSAYLPPDAFQTEDDYAKGREGGIGVVLEIDEGRLRVDEVVPDGPAWLAGVQAGDLVLAVDGRKVRGRRLTRSIEALDGPPGSEVTVRFRTGQMRARDLTLTRAYVPAPSVRAELRPGGVALLTIERFHLASATEFERRLTALMEQAGDDLSGIVIDLRDNLGGVIRPAAEIVDGFLDEGLVVYTRGRYPASRLEYQALPGQWAAGVPLVVLVNGQSASASEIVAAALQDHERALLVGERTYGKGTVQSIVELRNGSALKLTTARYYTPSGRTFDGTGIEPDVVVTDGNAPENDRRQEDDDALETALELLRRGEVPVGGDTGRELDGPLRPAPVRSPDAPGASAETG